MSAIQRMGDANDAGGVIDDIPQSTVYANNKLIAINGSKGTGHPPNTGSHVSHVWQTANGLSTVLIGGVPVNRTGNADSCGDTRIGGSSNVFVG